MKEEQSKTPEAIEEVEEPTPTKDALEDASDESSERDDIQEDHWKNRQYWALPENVRHAIDTAQLKKKHSDFYYRLRLLNDKIHIFTSIFYNKVPSYQRNWYIKQ